MLKYFPRLFLVFLIAACAADDTNVMTSTDLMVQKRELPVLTTTDGLVSDPTVIRRGDELLMVYSDYRLSTDSITFNAATSVDGVNWTKLNEDPDFRIFSGNPSGWDKLIETPDINVINDSIYLFYTGYPDTNVEENGVAEYKIGLARGESITSLVRAGNEPILTTGTVVDRDALTSPTIVRAGGIWHMLYTGWSDIQAEGGFLGQTGATSTDGLVWEKNNAGVFTAVIDTRFITATESELVKGPDELFYLLFSAEGGLGLARSDQPFGPWDIYPEFIVTPEFSWEASEVVAPAVLIEDGKFRIWYTGVLENFGGSSIGYAEIDFPLLW